MSTHAAIIQATAEGEYRGIYLNYDGYPEHAGRILKEHYTSDEAVTALIGLGDLSGIEATPEASVAYHRDRGEKKHIRASKDLNWIREQLDTSYTYLWEEGEWRTFTSSEFYKETQRMLQDAAEQAEIDAGWDPNP